MNIFFGTTTSHWQEYKEYYFAIHNYLQEIGCIILFDWVHDVEKTFSIKGYKERNINKIYRLVIQAIDEADAVVIEYTIPNFSSSHQINYALLKKKPTLVLRLHTDNPYWGNSYLEAIQSPLLHIKQYTLNTYRDEVDEFIGYSKIEQGQQRYNIVLGKQEKYYLDWASVQYKKSRSQIIRELIHEQIISDSQYKKYIRSTE